jgi:hypothetical protein
VYANAPNSVHLRGLAGGRAMHFMKEGLNDFVVW